MEVFLTDAGIMGAAASKALFALFQWHNLLFLSLGCMMGLVLGIVPGIGGLTGTAMLLPFTFSMEPVSAFALLLGLVFIESLALYTFAMIFVKVKVV